MQRNCIFSVLILRPIIAGDFNRLNISTIKKHFRLKQIVKKPTRKNAILDVILTNIHDYYENPCTFPPFGLSDHNTVTVEGKEREHSNAIKFVYTVNLEVLCQHQKSVYVH